MTGAQPLTRNKGEARSQIKIYLSASALATLDAISAKKGKAPTRLACELLEEILRDQDFIATMMDKEKPVRQRAGAS